MQLDELVKLNSISIKTRRYKKLNEVMTYLPRKIKEDQIGILDQISIEAKYTQLTSKKAYEGLEEVLEVSEKLRAPYREEKEMSLYGALTNRKNTYVNRFKEMEELMDDASYDDLAVSLLYLRRNRYLRRKSKDDELFAKKRELLEDKIKHKMVMYETRKKSRFKQNLVVGLATAAALFSAVPTSIYAFFQ